MHSNDARAEDCTCSSEALLYASLAVVSGPACQVSARQQQVTGKEKGTATDGCDTGIVAPFDVESKTPAMVLVETCVCCCHDESKVKGQEVLPEDTSYNAEEWDCTDQMCEASLSCKVDDVTSSDNSSTSTVE